MGYHHVAELSYLHSHDITFAVFCQGPYDESVRYRHFMGWACPGTRPRTPSPSCWPPPKRAGMMHLLERYLRNGDRVFEGCWTTLRGVQVMDNSYPLTDLTAYGRPEPWEDSPPGWPQRWQVNDNGEQLRTNGRPIAQWSRLEAGRSDDLGTAGR